MGLFNFGRIKEVIRYRNGDIFTTLLNGNANHTRLTPDVKLKYMLTNPALAKVVNLNCDVFSLAEIKRKDEKENDPLIALLKNPNYFQSQRQFLWNYRFWIMFGNAYLKPSSKRLDSEYQQIYWLEPTKLDWGDAHKKLDKMVMSKSAYNDALNTTIKYKYNDNSKVPIQLKELITYHDLTNGIGNWYAGFSRIDALWKVLSNSEAALDAKNINLEFSRKFLVSGNYDPSKDLNSLATMQDIEKTDIKNKLRGNEPVHPLKMDANIKRFVDDLAKLQLDDSYNNDLMKIGSMYNIPSDVLEALKEGSTYENQEKSIGRHINYSEMPKALDLLEGLCTHFGLNVGDYEVTFNNNSFMQVFEKDKAVVNMTNARTLDTLVKNGADANAVAEYLGMDLEFKKMSNEQV
ncbi:MAG: phage portal protein [Flavobacteriaceae bacterium]